MYIGTGAAAAPQQLADSVRFSLRAGAFGEPHPAQQQHSVTLADRRGGGGGGNLVVHLDHDRGLLPRQLPSPPLEALGNDGPLFRPLPNELQPKQTLLLRGEAQPLLRVVSRLEGISHSN